MSLPYSPAITESCVVKVLPPEKWAEAAQKAVEINPANALPVNNLRAALADTVIPPQHLALLTAKRWPASGVRLTVGFLDNPAADLRSRLLSHMNAWGEFANVKFVETATNPQVRIARNAGDGYWSFVGTDILSIPADQQTMNLDSFTMNTPESQFHRVVRHETGHTLGFPHEHTRSDIVNRIDREQAIAYFMATQGWTRDQVIAQVLTPLDNSALIATAQADTSSIMCYWLPASIMKDSVAVTGGSDIDALDAQFASQVYPIQRQSSKAAPSVTAFNGRLWDAFVANNSTNQLLICSSADGQIWTDNSLIHGELSKTAPSLAVFNNRFYVAFVANNNSNNLLICSSPDGQNWTGNSLVHGGESGKTAPALAVFNNRMYVAFVANNNTNNVLICSTADGQNWTGNSVVHGGESSKTAPSLAVLNNRMYVAFVANNNTNNVLICSTADGQNWTGNSVVHGGESSKDAPSLTVFNGRLYVSFIANNSTNQVLLCSTADGTNWTGNIVI
jgi:astacin (peptidase family M12A)